MSIACDPPLDSTARLNPMRTPIKCRFALLIAAVLVLGWLQASHIHGPHEDEGDGDHPVCELCASFARVGAPPSPAAAVVFVSLWVLVLAGFQVSAHVQGSCARYRARAPPLLS
jgi:hypothetical protein